MHQIRSTLAASIAYIVNPEKTHNGSLVTTHDCAATPGAADLIANDFLLLQDEADQMRTTGARPTVLALHVIQSFKPGEVTAEQAHQIGIEFADQITGGNHQYVLATHTDRGHVHNHLIFNPVNDTTLKRYRTPKRKLFEIRAISDELCRSHGLNVITEDPDRDSTQPTLGERHARVRGASTKDALRFQIDKAVANTTDLSELVTNLQSAGIEVTFRGREMLVRDTASMQRPIRAWRLGPAYSESNLAARLGKSPVVTFTVAPSRVKELDKHMLQVAIPKLPGYYLSIPKGQATNHGSTWHLHLSEGSTTPVINVKGDYEVAFTPEELTTWFTPYVDKRLQHNPAATSPTRRGKTDKQRAYFASIDRRSAALTKRLDVLNFKAELLRLTPTDRAALAEATQHRITLAEATLRLLVIDRDQSLGAGRTDIENQIERLVAVITDDKQTLGHIETIQHQPDENTKNRRGPSR